MDLESWMGGIRRDVDDILDRFFESKCEEASRLSPQAIELVTEVRDLTMRGGKRLRPIVTAAAYRAASGASDLSPTFEVGAALELLQENRGTEFVYYPVTRAMGNVRSRGPGNIEEVHAV